MGMSNIEIADILRMCKPIDESCGSDYPLKVRLYQWEWCVNRFSIAIEDPKEAAAFSRLCNAAGGPR